MPPRPYPDRPPHRHLPPHHDFVDDLRSLARGPLIWISPDWTGLVIVEKARTLQAQLDAAATAAPERHEPASVALPSPLTAQQQQVKRRGQLPIASAPDLADDEVAVLRDLAAGFKQEEIADNLHLSIAKVERMIGTLKHKFGVASTNALCAQAGRFGFIES